MIFSYGSPGKGIQRGNGKGTEDEEKGKGSEREAEEVRRKDSSLVSLGLGEKLASGISREATNKTLRNTLSTI